jgi:hypothetical protein
MLWVALGSKARDVAIVDVSTRSVRTFRSPFLAHDVGWAPDGRHIWVSSGDRQELAVYDARTGRLIARPDADWPPQHVTFAARARLRHERLERHRARHNVEVESFAATGPLGSTTCRRRPAGRHAVAGPRCAHGPRHEWPHVYRAHVARSSHDACVV